MKLNINAHLLKAANTAPRPSVGLQHLADRTRVMADKARTPIIKAETIHCGVQAWVRARMMPSVNAPRRTGIYGLPVLLDPALPLNCAEFRNYLGQPIMRLEVN